MARQRNLYRKKLEKILKKIDTLASKGRDQELPFIKYVNELLDKGDYKALEDVLFIYYNIDVKNARSVSEHLKTTWKDICEQTKSNYTKRIGNVLKSLAKKYNLIEIYQLGLDVYIKKPDYNKENGINIKIGELRELESFSDETQYHVKNKQYARLIGDRRTYIEIKLLDDTTLVVTGEQNSRFGSDRQVSKITGDETVIMSEELQTIERYRESFEILLNQEQLLLDN
jgi:hypothetical protein